MIMVFLSVFHRYATMLVGTVARYPRNKNESCHRKTCTWHAGTNTANVNVTDGVLSATRKAYGVVRAVETTVCPVPVILKGIETNFEITYNFFILMTINL